MILYSLAYYWYEQNQNVLLVCQKAASGWVYYERLVRQWSAIYVHVSYTTDFRIPMTVPTFTSVSRPRRELIRRSGEKATDSEGINSNTVEPPKAK